MLLPGYDINLARVLVQGVDVWLNNPERPQEASGTSGQKAALNGVPNCSIRDGWWDEGYNGKNGWAFGAEVGDDEIDSAQLYDVLENEVIPAYYARNAHGLPEQWIATMKEAMRTCAPAFSALRMLKDYTKRLYL
jgi:starch phosphorylase